MHQGEANFLKSSCQSCCQIIWKPLLSRIHTFTHSLPPPPVICNQRVIIWHTPTSPLCDYVIYLWPLTGWHSSPGVYLYSDSSCTHMTPYPSSRFPPNLWHFVLWANRKSLNIFFWEICSKKIWKIQSVSKHFLAYSELPISKMFTLWDPNNSLILDALRWVL